MKLYQAYRDVYQTLEDLFNTVEQCMNSLQLHEVKKLKPEVSFISDVDNVNLKDMLELIRISFEIRKSSYSQATEINYIPVTKDIDFNLLSIINFRILKEKKYKSLFCYNTLPIYNPKGEVLLINKGKGIGNYVNECAYHIYKILESKEIKDSYELIPISCVLKDRIFPLVEGLNHIDKKLSQDYLLKACTNTQYSRCISQLYKAYCQDIKIKDLEILIKRYKNLFFQNGSYFTSYNSVKELVTPTKLSVIPTQYKEINLKKASDSNCDINQFDIKDNDYNTSLENEPPNEYQAIILYDSQKYKYRSTTSSYYSKDCFTTIKQKESLFQRELPFSHVDESFNELLYQPGILHRYKESVTCKDILLPKQSIKSCFPVQAPGEYFYDSLDPYYLDIKESNLQRFKVIPYGVPNELDRKGFYPKDFEDFKIKIKTDDRPEDSLTLYKELLYFIHIVKKTYNKYPADGVMISLIPAVYTRSEELIEPPFILIHFYEHHQNSFRSSYKNYDYFELVGIGEDRTHLKTNLFGLLTTKSTIDCYIPTVNSSDLTRGQIARQNMLDIILEHNWVYRYKDESPFLLRGFIKYQKEDVLIPIKACSYFFKFLDYLPRFKYENYFLGGKKKRINK